MAIYSQGVTTIMLTTEGASKANELKKDGIDVKVTHMRIYRTPTPVQEIPYKFTGAENKNTLLGWSALPNPDTTFEVIENYPTVPMLGYLTMIGTLGADIGTFSYDAVGLFLADDTLYAIAVTGRLLTKRKAAVGTTSNIQELSFNIAHSTVNEITDFRVNETLIDYARITEVEYPHLLPKPYNKEERVYRLTNGSVKTYTGNGAFITTLASQANMKLVGSSRTAPVWVLSDYIKLFDRLALTYTLTPGNKVIVSLPTATLYPLELISKDRTFVLSLADPDSKVKYSALRLILNSQTTDAVGYTFTFDVMDVSLDLTADVRLQGILATRNDDGIYQDSIKTALRRMTNIQYSMGRRFKGDSTNHPNTILRDFFGHETEWVKYDNRLEISTSQYDGRVYAPSMLQPIINKPGSVDHVPLRASNIWLRSDGSDLSPTLVLDKLTLFYSDFATATIQAPGYPNGSRIAWYCIPSRAGSLTEPTRHYGYAEVQNGIATFYIRPTWRLIKELDYVVVGLVGYPDQETTVNLEILVLESFFSMDEEGNNKITSANEGEIEYYHVRTSNGLVVDVPLYLTRLPGSTVSDDDLETAIPNFFSLVGGKYMLPLSIKEDETTEGLETLILGVAMESDFSDILTQASLNVEDTSTTPDPSYTMYFAHDAGGINAIRPATILELGSGTIYLIVKATNVPIFKDIVVDLDGSVVLSTDTDPVVPDPLYLQLVNGFVSYPITTKGPKVVTPPDPGGGVIRELRITQDRMTTYFLYDEFVALYGNPTANTIVKLYVNSGVTVVGTTYNDCSLDCTGSWPAGVPITVENAGNLLGRGGDGGVNNRSTAGNGTKGGDGVKAQPSNPVIINNSGIVAGGGGGGGSAFVFFTLIMAGSYPYGIPNSGSGGRPLGIGGGNGTSPSGYVNEPIAGSNATLSAPGQTNGFNSQGASIGVMKGGDLGTDGMAGQGNKNRNGIGGASGYRSIGPVTINNIGSGAYYGNAAQ